MADGTAGGVVSRRVTEAGAALGGLLRFLTESAYAGKMGATDICDFTFGNPHALPPEAFVAALRANLEPRSPSWYAYAQSEPGAQAAVARELAEESGLPYEPDDVVMTTGAFGAIAVSFATLLDPGDEVVYGLPPWFCYEPMIRHLGAVPVKVPYAPPRFDIDLEGLEAAITERTRVVVLNTPSNPTGRIYGPEELAALGALLERASARHGRPIVLHSDEPYRRLRFDGRPFHFPAAHYPWTVTSYSWGKILLTPGARLGYLAVGPHCPDRQALRRAAASAAISGGWLFPNALLQHATAELLPVGIDVGELERKRDHVVSALRAAGYEVESPEGTFYLLPKSPIADDLAFTARLARDEVYVLPGTLCEIPGYFRVCLTATWEMIERALPVFEAARRELG